MTRQAHDLSVGQTIYIDTEQESPFLSFGGGFFGPSISTDRTEYEIVEHRYDPRKRLVTLTIRTGPRDTCVTVQYGADAQIEVKK